MVTLLKAAIVAGNDASSGKSERFLIDGFPRSQENMEAWLGSFSEDEMQVRWNFLTVYHFLRFRNDRRVILIQ